MLIDIYKRKMGNDSSRDSRSHINEKVTTILCDNEIKRELKKRIAEEIENNRLYEERKKAEYKAEQEKNTIINSDLLRVYRRSNLSIKETNNEHYSTYYCSNNDIECMRCCIDSINIPKYFMLFNKKHLNDCVCCKPIIDKLKKGIELKEIKDMHMMDANYSNAMYYNLYGQSSYTYHAIRFNNSYIFEDFELLLKERCKKYDNLNKAKKERERYDKALKALGYIYTDEDYANDTVASAPKDEEGVPGI
jgi:hypothetical protein